MKIALRGNFGLPFTTESHVAWSFEDLGHTVIRIQENEVDWSRTLELCRDADLFTWISTWGFAHQWDQDEAWAAVYALNNMLPTAAFHLDRFWGLTRSDQLAQEPWFKLHYVFTADGGSQAAFEQHGINHVWLPPGVFGRECYDAPAHRRFQSDLCFVGSWQAYGHPEHEPYRMELLRRLKDWYGPRIQFWPQGRAIRGHRLNQLYASVKLAIGDSCIGNGAVRYWSDRIPETIGRGGFLIHPGIEGLQDVHPYVPTWTPGDWDGLHELIELLLADDDHRNHLRVQAAADVRANHTYANRMQTLIDTVVSNKPSEEQSHESIRVE